MTCVSCDRTFTEKDGQLEIINIATNQDQKQENNVESGGMYKGVMDEKATIVDLLGLGDEANSIPVAHLRTSLESRENSGAAYSFSSFESDNEDSDVDGQ